MSKTSEEMLGIIFNESDSSHSAYVDSDDADYILEYNKGEEYFSVYEKKVAFYKGVEKAVRDDQFYRVTYPKYLKEVIGLQECQIFGHIEDSDRKKVSMEIHHGPILTLYDVCEIVTNWYRQYIGQPSTLKVADIVLEEHRLNNVQVVKLCKSAHDAVTNGEVHLTYSQGFGDLLSFLVKFKDGLTRELVAKINRELKWSAEHDTEDNDIFVITQNMRKWENDLFLDFDEDEEPFEDSDEPEDKGMRFFSKWSLRDRFVNRRNV